MLGCNHIISIGFHAMELMEFLQLGKLDKGLVSIQGNYTSLTSLWFRYKYKKHTESKLKK